MKKFFIILVSSILLLFGTVGVNTNFYASASSKIKLTPEQEKQAEEIVDEWLRFERLTNKLNESEIERLFQVTGNDTQSDFKTSKFRTSKVVNDIVIANSKEEIDILNEQLIYVDKPELPEGTVSVVLQGDDNFVATTEAGEIIILPFGFWGGAWQVAKCAAHLTLVLLPTSAAFKAVKALGGIKKTAQLLVGAGNAKDFAIIAGGVAAEILGIQGIYDNCLQW
ncbi:hypothetical protein [Lysinibacillus xylanilyticus]|uniref:hypothetical protein n=1 Tax=Lysinibacillus xylanilyticus TaxID=582475 RepID=UPI003CFF75B9